MGNTYLSDAQFDASAKAYARAHNVSYSEALNVVALDFSEQPSSIGNNRQATSAADVSDEALDRAAKKMAAMLGISYMDALTRLNRAASAKNFADRTRAANFSAGAGLSDIEMHERATQLMCERNINYSEALDHVASGTASTVSFRAVSSDTVSFAEGDGASYDASPASIMENQWIEIFRAGTHTTSDGQSITFSLGDISAIASNYRPSQREAPLVEGHPPLNAPSRGWVDSLRAAGDTLLMRVKQVAPEFAANVKAGGFKKRSASFYPPNSPSNPTPGKWYLRHVGFLGAHQPALAGLKDIQFSAVN